METLIDRSTARRRFVMSLLAGFALAALLLVFRHGMKLAAVGIAIGMVGAAGLTQLMRKLLFEVQPLDPVAFPGAAILLAGFAALLVMRLRGGRCGWIRRGSGRRGEAGEARESRLKAGCSQDWLPHIAREPLESKSKSELELELEL